MFHLYKEFIKKLKGKSTKKLGVGRMQERGSYTGDDFKMKSFKDWLFVFHSDCKSEALFLRIANPEERVKILLLSLLISVSYSQIGVNDLAMHSACFRSASLSYVCFVCSGSHTLW